MANKSKKCFLINDLKLFRDRDASIASSAVLTGKTRSPKRSKIPKRDPAALATTAPSDLAPLGSGPIWWFENDGPFRNELAPQTMSFTEGQLQEFASKNLPTMDDVKFWLSEIDDTEELSQMFLDALWFCRHELHDELRRATSGPGKTAKLLAHVSGFAFARGLVESSAYRGDGPLSTPLKFYEPVRAGSIIDCVWKQDVIRLNALHREDALEVSCGLSFMMH